MPVFQIAARTAAVLTTVTNRVEKHGDDDKPAVTLAFQVDLPNTVLDLIDTSLRQALYMAKPAATPELPTVEASTPVLRSNAIDVVHLTKRAYEGWTLQIFDSVDEQKAPLVFGGCKVDKMTVEPKQGGTVRVRFNCGTSDVDDKRGGWLLMHNRQDVSIGLTAPTPAAEKPKGDGDGDGGKGRKRAAKAGGADPGAGPAATAEQLFAAGSGTPGAAPGEGGHHEAAYELADAVLRKVEARRKYDDIGSPFRT